MTATNRDRAPTRRHTDRRHVRWWTLAVVAALAAFWIAIAWWLL